MKFKNKYLLFFVFLFIVSQPVSSVLAITPTIIPTSTEDPITAQDSTPTPTPANSDEVQRIREAVQQKVKEKLNEIITKKSKKGLFGKIISANLDQITIERDNTPQIISLSTGTTAVGINKKNIDISQIKVGQTISALGYLQPDNSLDTRRIVVIDPKTISDTAILAAGRIVDYSTTSSLLVLVPFNNKSLQYQIKIDTKTPIFTKNKQKLTSLAISTGNKIVAILNPPPKGSQTYTASLIVSLDATAPSKTTPTP